MSMDIRALNKTKEVILSFIRRNGPSLPVQISKEANTSPLFASAFLSELYKEQKLLMSNLKVGSSPLYLLPGQQPHLENFLQYLDPKEQEAFHMLKEKQFLHDANQEPAIRVALREIKDFAVPIKLNSPNGPILIWKYFKTSNDELEELLNKKPKADPKPEPRPEPIPQPEPKPVPEPAAEPETPKPEEPKPEPVPIKEKPQPKESPKFESPVEKQKPEPQKQKVEPKQVEEETEQISLEFNKPAPPAKKTEFEKPSDLSNSILKYLKQRSIQIVEILSEKKKEITAIISVPKPFGRQYLYLAAKEKKIVKSPEIIEILKAAHALKMSALFLAPGSIEKKSMPTYQEWQNLIKFDQI